MVIACETVDPCTPNMSGRSTSSFQRPDSKAAAAGRGGEGGGEGGGGVIKLEHHSLYLHGMELLHRWLEMYGDDITSRVMFLTLAVFVFGGADGEGGGRGWRGDGGVAGGGLRKRRRAWEQNILHTFNISKKTYLV